MQYVGRKSSRLKAELEKNHQKSAYFEKIWISPDESFLWRMDDYPWKRCLWNYHPEFEIHYIRHSSGLSYVGDYIGTFNPGQVVLVGSNLPHNWITPSVGDRKLIARDIVVQFDPATFSSSSNNLPELAQIDPLFTRAAFGIEFLGETAVAAANMLEDMGTLSGLPRLTRLLDLLSVMARSSSYRTLATKQFVRGFQPGSAFDLDILKTSLDYVQTRFLDRPSLTEAAKLVNMSESSFSRFFKNHTGNNFSDHIATLRMWTARKLLSESDLAITEVCYESGFKNVSNFNRHFLADAGMPPSQYRNAARKRSISKA